MASFVNSVLNTAECLRTI